MATGDFCGGLSGLGGLSGVGSLSSGFDGVSITALPLRPSDGAMIAFSTLAEPQTGQVTSPRDTCLS